MSEVDVVVIGLGPGGEAAANKLASSGLEVVGVERDLVGGECPFYGCIPSKLMIRAAHVLAEAGRAGTLAGSVEVTPSWAPVYARIRDEATQAWDDVGHASRLEEAGVRIVRGHGRLDGPGRVRVGDDVFTARRAVVLNPGTRPGIPPIPGLEGTPFWTNREIVKVDTLPASLVVVGGGPIGLELAQAFSRFGVRVTVVEVADRIMAVEEPETSAHLARVLAGEGIRLLTGVQIQQVGYADGAFTVVLDGEEVHADKLLVAAGRRNNIDDLGLETVGLDPSARALAPDERMRVAEDLYAVGDATGHGAFTHMSMYQSSIAVKHILGEDGAPADYRAVPRVTYTDPEVGSVGLTEAQAREAGLDVRVAVTDLADSTRGWLHGTGDESGLVKVVTDGDLVVGASCVGPMGGEMLSMFTTAVHARVRVEDLLTMIYAYPTWHRAVRTALDELA